MKKVPPSMRMKEDVERVLRGETIEEPAEARCTALCLHWHVTSRRSRSRGKPRRFLGAGTVVGPSERIQDGGTATQPSACKPRLGCWNWRCRKCVRPRNRLGRRWSSGWDVSPGKHRIKIELLGYQTFETEINLLAGQKSEVKTELMRGSIEQAGALVRQP
jgi:hypothetical protein